MNLMNLCGGREVGGGGGGFGARGDSGSRSCLPSHKAPVRGTFPCERDQPSQSEEWPSSQARVTSAKSLSSQGLHRQRDQSKEWSYCCFPQLGSQVHIRKLSLCFSGKKDQRQQQDLKDSNANLVKMTAWIWRFFCYHHETWKDNKKGGFGDLLVTVAPNFMHHTQWSPAYLCASHTLVDCATQNWTQLNWKDYFWFCICCPTVPKHSNHYSSFFQDFI